MGIISSLIVALTVQTDDFDSSLRGVEKSLDRTAGKFSDVGASLTESLTLPIIGLGAGAATMAASFDDSFEKMVGLTHVSAGEVDGLRDSVLQLAGQTAQSPKELADALMTVESAGIHGKQAIDLLKDSAMASTAGLGAVRDIAGVVSSAINAYGASNLSATQATSMLVASAKEMKNGAEDLIPSISKLFPLAASLKIPISDLGAAMAVMSNSGLDATKASMALNQILVMLEKPAAASEKVLAQTGLTFNDLKTAAGESGLGGVLKLLAQHFQGNDQALAQLFPNARSMSAVFALMRSEGQNSDDVFARLSKTTGQTLNEAFDAVAKGPAFQFKQLMSELQVLMIRIGDDVLPVIIPVVDQMAAAIEKAANYVATLNPATRDLIVILAGTAAAIGPVIVGMGAMLSGLSSIIAAVRLVTSGIAISFIPALLPLLALVLSWAVLADIVVGHWQELKIDLGIIFDWLKEKIDAVFGGTLGTILQWAGSVGSAVKNVASAIGQTLPSFSDMSAAVKNTGNDIVQYLTPGIQKILDVAKGMASGMVGSFQTATSGVTASVAQINQSVESTTPVLQRQISLWAQFETAVMSPINQVKEALNTLTTGTFQDSQKIQSALVSMGTTAATNLGTLTSQFLEGKRSFSDMVNSMIDDLVRLVAEMLVYAAIATAIGGPFGQAFAGGVSSGLFPKRAAGGPLEAGQTAIVGENGPELFTPAVAGNITPNSALGAGGGGMNQTVQQYFNFTGMDYGSTEAAKRLAIAIKDAAKEGTQESIQLGLQLQKLADQYAGRAV